MQRPLEPQGLDLLSYSLPLSYSLTNPIILSIFYYYSLPSLSSVNKRVQQIIGNK